MPRKFRLHDRRIIFRQGKRRCQHFIKSHHAAGHRVERSFNSSGNPGRQGRMIRLAFNNLVAEFNGRERHIEKTTLQFAEGTRRGSPQIFDESADLFGGQVLRRRLRVEIRNSKPAKSKAGVLKNGLLRPDFDQFFFRIPPGDLRSLNPALRQGNFKLRQEGGGSIKKSSKNIGGSNEKTRA